MNKIIPIGICLSVMVVCSYAHADEVLTNLGRDGKVISSMRAKVKGDTVSVSKKLDEAIAEAEKRTKALENKCSQLLKKQEEILAEIDILKIRATR